jgi:hypothetical protein
MDERTDVLALSLRDRMEHEEALFAGLVLEVERLRDALQEKHWSAGLALAQGIERSAEKIGMADASRDKAFMLLRDAMDLPRETAFSALLPRLPEALRGEVEESWRRLRVTVMRLKTATGRIRYAAGVLSDTLARILEEVFPYRKGKIYSRRGTPTSVAGALLVDRTR